MEMLSLPRSGILILKCGQNSTFVSYLRVSRKIHSFQKATLFTYFKNLNHNVPLNYQIMYTCFQLIRLYLKVDKEVIQFDLAEAMTKVLATSLQKSADQTNTEQMIWRIKGRRVLNIQTNSKSNQGIQHLELMYKIKLEPYFGCC